MMHDEQPRMSVSTKFPPGSVTLVALQDIRFGELTALDVVFCENAVAFWAYVEKVAKKQGG